ncbi:programmed cell death protein [Anaeramoeba flamelloides]|uniref:Programmed cell death protein n=1 Tax=Anaeramoeba flamelloides TaxID=1746091 RepID=A0ABQ8YR95_9EUKA|nr:programmed cell death protein [Anaeramoeba flamelloides]
MSQKELEEIRKKRLQQMKSKYSPQSSQEMQKKQQQMEIQRQSALSQLMTVEARERLKRIGLVKPEKVRSIENRIIQMARMYQGRKITENELITILEQLAEKETKVTIQRRNWDLSDSDDEL